MPFYQKKTQFINIQETDNLSNQNQQNGPKNSLLSKIPLINSMQQYERIKNSKILFEDLIDNFNDDELFMNYNYSTSYDSSSFSSPTDPIEQIENDLKMYCIQNSLF